MTRPFRTAPMKDGIRYNDKGEPIREAEMSEEAGLREALVVSIPVDGLDLMAIDRLLAVSHREDDEPCSCDECMSYGAEDFGADWYRIPVANQIAMRILDGADDRFAVLLAAFRDHDDALAIPAPAPADGLDVERLARAMERETTYLAALTKRFGRFNGAWYDKAAESIAREYAALAALALPEPEPRGPTAPTLCGVNGCRNEPGHDGDHWP